MRCLSEDGEWMSLSVIVGLVSPREAAGREPYMYAAASCLDD